MAAGGYFKSSDPIGAVAQLGERRVRNAEVEGSSPFRSTSLDNHQFRYAVCPARTSLALILRVFARRSSEVFTDTE
jgi:hypothetical protein